MGQADAEPTLQHVLIVGGTRPEWDALTAAQWLQRLEELGKIGDRAGARWLTIRPFPNDDDAPDGPHERRTLLAGSCTVTADSDDDGRQRLVNAARALRAAARPITEATLGAVLNEPAHVEPDLVVVLGPPTRLPRSLVWELAYSELVFVDIRWADLAADHLAEALHQFATRHRRFGGLD